jgi:hypothetical protein
MRCWVFALVALGMLGCSEGPAADSPAPVTSCSSLGSLDLADGRVCQGDLHCVYSEFCCCGTCRPSTWCDCFEGRIGCVHAKQHCDPCSPGCPERQFITPSGCQDCSIIQAELPKAVSAVLADVDECTQDIDCAPLWLPGLCGTSCPAAVNASQTAVAAEAVTTLADAWCGPEGAKTCQPTCTAKPTDTPKCVQGRCRLVGLCNATAGEFSTPDGCLKCPALHVELPKAVSAVMSAFDSCSENADCVELGASVCGPACPTAVAMPQYYPAMQALAKLAGAWCWSPLKDCAVVCPATRTGIPECVQGRCHLWLAQCDPLDAPPGTSCDDGDSQTLDDTCVGPGVCRGAPAPPCDPTDGDTDCTDQDG